MAEDETFPPEIQKSPAEFGFRELRNLKTVDSNQQPAYDSNRSSLLVVSNRFGHVFVGTPKGVKVFSSIVILDTTKKSEAEVGPPIAAISLRHSPNWLGLSSDNLTFSVSCRTDKGPQILFFDVRNILNKTKPTKTPFQSLFLSKSPAAYVTSLKWNPSKEFTNLLAICLSTGSFHLLSVEKSVQEVATRPDNFGASAVCWSPKGKQMIVGKTDGSLHQLTQKLEIRRTVTVTNVIDRSVKTCDLLWLSAYHVGAAYVACDDNSFNQPNLFLADMPSKDEKRDVIWKNYEDPCFGMNESKESQYFFTSIEEWQMFVSLSSNSTDIAVIGKNQDSQVWEIWTLDDSSRAALPISDFTEDDSVPIGADIIMNSKDRIMIGDSKDCGPMPVLAVLTNDGVLCLYNMINLIDTYPSVVRPEESLDFSEERTAVYAPSVGSGDVGKSPLSYLKQKLSAKPSLTFSSTPKSAFFSDERSQPGPPLTIPSTPVFTASTPVVAKPPPFFEGPSMIHQLVHSKMQTKLPAMTAAPLVKSPHTAAISLKQDEAADVPKKKESRKPVQRTLMNFSNDTPSFADKTSKPGEKASTGAISRGEASSVEAKRFTRPKWSMGLPGYSSGDQETFPPVNKGVAVDLRTAMEDVTNFQSELDTFLSSTSEMENALKLLENESEKKGLTKKMDNLKIFSDEISRTSRDLSCEIQDASTALLALTSKAEDFNRKQSQTETGLYKALLYSRPLVRSKQEKLEAIRGLYQYVIDSVRDTNAALDAEWERAVGKRRKAGFRKRNNRDSLGGDWENAYMGLVNNMKILHQQEVKVMQLSQQLDRVRLEKTSLKKPVKIPVKSSKVNTSSNLQLLADTLLPQQGEDETKPPAAHTHLTVSHAAGQGLSPKKQVQLGQMLAKRKVAPVRVSQKTSTSIMVKGTHRVQQENQTVSSGLDNESSPIESSSETSSVTSSLEETSQEGNDFNSMMHQRNLAEGIGSKQSFSSASGSRSSSDVLCMGGVDQPLQPKYSMIPQGSATLAYGAPKSATAETRRREIPLLSATTVEATSNLNNPPQVVNIQKFDIPLTDDTPFPEKFEPKPEVPIGAAKVVQNVLNLVKAEKQCQQMQDFSHNQDAIKSNPHVSGAPLGASVKSVPFTQAWTTMSTCASANVVLPSPSASSLLALDKHLSNPQKSALPQQIFGVLSSNKEPERPRKGVSKSASMPLVTCAPPLSTITLVSSPAATTVSKSTVFTLSSSNASGSLPELFKLGSSSTSSLVQTAGDLSSVKSVNVKPTNSSTLSTFTSSIKENSNHTTVRVTTLDDNISTKGLEETASEKFSASGPSSAESENVKANDVACSVATITAAKSLCQEQLHVSETQTAPVKPSGIQVKGSESDSKVSIILSSSGESTTTATSSESSPVIVSSLGPSSSEIPGKLFHVSGTFATSTQSTDTVISTSDENSTAVAASITAQQASAFSSETISSGKKTIEFGVDPATTSSPFQASIAAQPATAFSNETISSGKKTIEFGVDPATTSSPFQTSSVFGKVTSGESEPFFGSAPSSDPFQGSRMFGKPDTKPFGSVFESMSTPFQAEQAFGKASADKPLFGTPSSFGEAAPGTSQLFGSVPTQPKLEGSGFGSFATPAKETPANVFGGFGFSGLGGKPSNEASKMNPFQASATSEDEPNSSTLFGTAGAKSFGQLNSGFGQGFGSSAFKSSAGGVGSQGFGGFNKPQQSVFGAAPTFGSPPSFGSSTNHAFGTGFGAQPLSSQGTFGQTSESGGGGFASFAKNDAPGFGNIASTGNFGASQSPAFGSNEFTQQNQKAPSFSGWR